MARDDIGPTDPRTDQEEFVRRLQETYAGKTVARIHVDRNSLNGEHELAVTFTDGARLEVATAENHEEPFACRLFINNTDYEHPF